MNKLLLVGSHTAAVAAGFALGIYVLPILTAPEPPSSTELAMLASGAAYRGEFRRDLKDSDALHWGEGTVYVGAKAVTLMGQLAPGYSVRRGAIDRDWHFGLGVRRSGVRQKFSPQV